MPRPVRHRVGGEIRASGLGAMQVVVMDIMPITVRRTRELIAEADPDMLKMVLLCGGNSCVVDQGDRQARLTAGDFAVYDTRRPYEIVCGADGEHATQMMTFMFPPSMMPLPRNRLGGLTATRFPASAGLGDLTSQFLLQLARNIEHYSPAEAARLSAAALEVLATRLAHVQAFINRHLGDPDLTPATVAAANHLSLRSLHQLFHDEGLTVAGWIRRRRLEACRCDLSDPALAGRPVAAIASRWGFSSAADFSRVFRAVHGLPPSEYRRFARDVNVSAL